MSAGRRLTQAGAWTPVYQAPSLGFVYVTNINSFPVRINWRAYTSSPFFYSDGSTTIQSGEQKAIPFGIPTSYVQFEVNPDRDCFLFGS